MVEIAENNIYTKSTGSQNTHGPPWAMQDRLTLIVKEIPDEFSRRFRQFPTTMMSFQMLGWTSRYSGILAEAFKLTEFNLIRQLQFIGSFIPPVKIHYFHLVVQGINKPAKLCYV